MKNYKAPSYMGGGGTELNKFDLQRFAEVENPYETIINSNIVTSGLIEQPLINLSYYARYNIANYGTITTIPQENIEYLSSGLSASNCVEMFHGCRQLTSIPWNDFDIDTSQCTSMRYMFWDCDALTSLDLSSLDTSEVTDIKYMFWDCTALASLDLSNFNTSKVAIMSYIFSRCGSLQEIICPNGFDMSSCTDIRYMFTDCTSYNGEPLHFKNVPRDLDFSSIGGTEGTHYVIDNYID